MAYINVTKNNFKQEVLDSSLPVIVDFWAVWCGFCTRLAPTLDELSEQYADKLKLVKINVDEEPELMNHYSVNVFPTLLLFDRGQELDRAIGAIPREDLENWLAENEIIEL